MTETSSRRPVTAPADRSGSLLWLQGLLCGALSMLLPGLALLLAAMLAPAIGAVLLDREPGRPAARCVALFALAGAMQPARRFWATSHSIADAIACLGEPRLLITVWTAAALGWLVAQLAPLFARLLLDVGSTARARRLRARRAHLLDEWAFGPGDQAAPISEG